MEVGLVVPVMSNFKGLTLLMATVDRAIHPLVINNWDHNHGVAAAWNAGIRDGMDLDVLVITNDDVMFYPETLDKLVESTQDLDLVSAVGSDTGLTGYHSTYKPDYACFAIKPKQFVESFGTFDENFMPAYFEDDDMSRRILLAGGSQAIRLDAQMHHVGSFTQNMGGNGDTDPRVVSHQQFEQNRDYYAKKWGGIPEFEAYDVPFNNQDWTIRDW